MAKKGRPTAEEAAIKYQKDKEEAKIRNKKRNADMERSRKQKNYKGQFESTKSRAEQLGVAMKQMLDRVIRESAHGFITDVDFFDEESAKRRKGQLSNLKDLLVIIRQMKDLMIEVAEDEQDEEKTSQVLNANVTLIEEARKQLKDVGLKADI